MLDAGADINYSATSATVQRFDGTWGGEGYTPLNIAIGAGNYAIAKLLIDRGADIKIGSEGFTILENSRLGLKCVASVSKKLPIYWAVEGADLELVKKLGDMMTWEFNPRFTIKQAGGGGGGGTVIGALMRCKRTASKIMPSAWAKTFEWKEAADYLVTKGL